MNDGQKYPPQLHNVDVGRVFFCYAELNSENKHKQISSFRFDMILYPGNVKQDH